MTAVLFAPFGMESDMEFADNACRLCDKVSEQMYDIFEKTDGGKQIVQLIKEVLPIVIYRNDPLPKQICDLCFENLETSYQLRSTALDTLSLQKERLRNGCDEEAVELYLQTVENGEMKQNGGIPESHDVATSTHNLKSQYCKKCQGELENEQITELHAAIADSLKTSHEIEIIPTLRPKSHLQLAAHVNGSTNTASSQSESDLDMCDSDRDGTQSEPDNTQSECSQDEIQFKRMTRGQYNRDPTQSLINRPHVTRSQSMRCENDANKSDKTQPDQNTTEDKSKLKPEVKENKTEEEDSESESHPPVQLKNKESVLKRSLEESPLLAPEIKRRKIGPKSRTKPRNVLESTVYNPLSLMQCVLSHLNKENVPGYRAIPFETKIIYEIEPVCLHCDEMFPNTKLLALHEAEDHIQVNLFDRVDDDVLWNKARVDAYIRNKWYEDEITSNQCPEEEEHVDVEGDDGENLLVPITPNLTVDKPVENGITLIDCKPFVNGVPLADLDKEERRTLYKNIIISGLKRKFCSLCRFTFKDNWAIELHYFTSACYYTCRYCGVRFNKQRPIFEDHVSEHLRAGHKPSKKIYAARKKNDPIPKVVDMSIVKLEESPVTGEEDKTPKSKVVKPIKMKNLFEKTGYATRSSDEDFNGFPPSMVIKREPGVPTTPQPNIKTKATPGDAKNQAYFCRKCYKVFFKLDEFNVHVKACNGSGVNLRGDRDTPTDEWDEREEPSTSSRRSTRISSSGRPVRNCVKEVGSYNDNFDVEMDSDVSHSSSPISGFQCNMCNSIFPTVQSRNSHMRIHKSNGPIQFIPVMQNQPTMFKPQKPQPNLAKQVVTNMINRQRKEEFNNKFNYENVFIKQEPMEPEVQIHETEIPSSIGNVSITPIPRNPAPKPQKTLDPDIMRLVQNNPNITIRTMKKHDGSEAHQVNSKGSSGQRSSTTSNFNQQRHSSTSTFQRSREDGSHKRDSSGFQRGSSGFRRNESFPGRESSGFQGRLQGRESSSFQNRDSAGFQRRESSGFQARESSGFQSRESSNFRQSEPNFQRRESGFHRDDSRFIGEGSIQRNSDSSFQVSDSSGIQFEDSAKCYRCSSCSKPFSNKSNLYFHKKNQCGGSKYPCPFCKKRFGTESAYSSHIFYSHPE